MCSVKIQKVRLGRRKSYSGLLVSTMLIMVFCALSIAGAQETGPSAPEFPPGQPLPEAPGISLPIGPRSLFFGKMYFEAGVKYRNLQTVTGMTSEFIFDTPQIDDLDETRLPENRHPFANKIWSPSFEVGYQASNFSDLFAGFSWYTLANHARFRQVAADDPNFVADITYSLDMDGYETRGGVRSWYPLWGLGRIGATLGGFTTVIPFTVNVTRDASDGAGNSGSGSHDDVWIQIGLVGGLEAEIDLSRLLVKAGVEYSWGSSHEYGTLFGTQTEMRPSGFNATFSGGYRF